MSFLVASEFQNQNTELTLTRATLCTSVRSLVNATRLLSQLHHHSNCYYNRYHQKLSNQSLPSEIMGRSRLNENIWPDVDVIKRKIESYRSRTRSSLPVIIFNANYPETQPTGQDALYIWYRKCYSFIILHYPAEKKLIMGDGENMCFNNEEFLEEVREAFPDCEFKCVEFKSQTCIDHGASSAIMLGIRFLSIDGTKSRNWPSYYYAPSKTHNLIKNQLYKRGRSKAESRSIPFKEGSNLHYRPRVKCDKPNCTFSRSHGKLSALVFHRCPQ